MDKAPAVIKDLNQKKEVTTLYKNEREIRNFQTGEIYSAESNQLTKEKKRERFIKVFIDNLDYMISGLEKLEKSAIWTIMQQMNYHNIISLTSDFRKFLQADLGVAQGTTSKLINSLIAKKVIIKISNDEMDKFGLSRYSGKEYLVNPQLIGQGSMRELENMRRIVTTDYDFVNLSVRQEIKTETKYSDFDNVISNKDNHEIVLVKENTSPDGRMIEREIRVAESDDISSSTKNYQEVAKIPVIKSKEPNIKNTLLEHIDSLDLTDEQKFVYECEKQKLQIIDKEIEQKKLELKEKELDNERIEKENENLRLKLELAKLQNKDNL